MDLVAGGVLHGRLPIRPLRFPLVLRSLPSPAVAVSAALPGCPCPPIVRRNAPAVVPFAKKKRKGYRDDPPDEEAADGLVDEWEEDEEVEEGEDFDDDDEDIMDEEGEDDYDFEDDFESDEEQDLYVGDGGAGGGISLAGTWWDKEVLALAEQVSASFDDDLKIYAFKTAANLTIRVRIEKMSTRYGSPTIDDIEAYTIAYRAKLDDAESAGKIPQNISLEVSSPGVERVVCIPEELERFKERAMYVRYTTTSDEAATPQEGDGVLRLVSYDMDLGECTWGVADVKINRQQAGKGRPLSKKQREWRLQTPFESLKLVRLYSEC
ncbi:uncharacterized protein LOC120641046 [Panicum virgatum]|uniref:Ribosome maturation factor RimP N-terminal domain-containing protein n=1 Tax=Panicum virgatum TaxID=38727 RepID=A0A8T0QHE0_PANVG|nr:uncharacterized protein LOC120641046 [Panicum virgatum]KAG2572239.1 hypothetical protein PVAP13_7KG162300 [Panicum virgatum]